MNPKPKTFLIIHVLTLFLSFFVVVPMGMISTEFNGYCLLYAKGNFSASNKTNKLIFNLSEWGSSSNCNYILFVGILLLLSSAGFVWNYAILLFKENDKAPFASFVTWIASSVITLCTFISALILTVGFKDFCSDFFESRSSLTCSADNIDFSIRPKYGNISTKGFFTRIHVAEFGIWCGLLTWLMASILAFFKVYYYHKSDDLLQALAFEKQTLLNRRSQYQHLHEENFAPKA